MRLCNRVFAVLFLISLLASAQSALGVELVIQPGPADGKDTYVRSADPDLAYGTQTYLYFGGGLPGEQRLFIQFDLASLDETSLVDTAQLELYMGSQNGFMDGFNYSVMQITAPWVENTLTWNTQPVFDPLAITAFSGNDWQGQIGTWRTITGLEGLVQFWVENPAQNFGLLIKPTAGSYGYPLLWSSEYSNASLRPRLVINGDLVPVAESSWGGLKALY